MRRLSAEAYEKYLHWKKKIAEGALPLAYKPEPLPQAALPFGEPDAAPSATANEKGPFQRCIEEFEAKDKDTGTAE
jgi:hypothetical protein